MMKKILSVLVLSLVYTFCSAQSTQYLGAPTTIVETRGTHKVDSAFVPPTDTLASAPLGSHAFKNGVPYYKNASGYWFALPFISDVFNMPEIKTYVFTQGVSASNTVANYSATEVDTAQAFFTGTPLGGTSGGGVLFNSTSGDSIRIKMPFWIGIGHSFWAGHPGHVGPLEVGGWTPNYPDSFGTYTWAIDSLTHMKGWGVGIGGQISTQVRARWMRDAIGLNSNPNDGRTTLTIAAKPSFIVLDAFINDPVNNVPDSISRGNYIWMAQVAMEYGIPLVVTTSSGDGSITSPTIARQVERFNAWLLSGALAPYNVTVVDIFKSWATSEKNVTKPGPLVAPDKIHLTKAGYNTIGAQIFNDAKLPVLTKIVVIHGNSATLPLTNWNRPTTGTFNGVAVTFSNPVYDTIPINFYVGDTLNIKITGSVNVSGSSVNTGINTVEAFLDNNPSSQPWYTKKTNFNGAHTADLDVSTLKITSQSYTNGMKLITVLSNDNAYHYLDLIGNPGGSSMYVNFGLSALTAINSAAFNVTGGIGATGAIYTTNVNSQFGQVQIGNTANPGTGWGLGIISSGLNMQYGASNALSGNGLTLQKWNTNIPTVAANVSYAHLNMPSGAGALGDRDSIFQIKLNPTWNNTATGVLPSFVGSIHYQPIVTALGAARHVAMWMETGENLFNTVSGKSAIGTFNPSGSAKFDVASTTQGAIFPRMTTAQRDSIGYISSITVTAGGSGYGAVYPTVTISGGSGSGATAYSNLASGAVTTVQIINPGIQYFGTAPTVAFGGPGSGTTATAVVHGPDNGLTIYNTTIDSLQYFNGTAWLNIGVNGLIRYKHTIFTPTTGGTVALVNGQYNIINPAGTLATLTVNLPSSPADRDVVYIKFTQIVTTVTYGNGTIVDGIVSPAAGGLVVLTYDSGTTSWY